MNQVSPQVCQLTHAGFRMLGEPIFRLGDGNQVPCMVVPLDNQQAVLPLRSLVREFNIDPDSADGKMLRLIEQALDFVVAVRIGDTLPSELQGIASWDPTDQDRRVASSRIWHSLVRCVFAKMGQSFDIPGGVSPGWESDPANQKLLRDAIAGAAGLLGDADPEATRSRVAAVIAELAYIEAMRRMLTRGISSIADKLMRRGYKDLPTARRETLKQVQSLSRRGIAEITRRFDEVDAALDDVLAMLRDMAATVADLRRKRDWLFRSNHAWTPMFNDWANSSGYFDEFMWKIVERSYLFLAPRYMPYQEWTSYSATKVQEPLVKVW
jgi:hypothetical protein